MDVLSSTLQPKALMLGVLIASFAAGGQAEAACTPTSPVNNTTVTCTGTTNDANGTNGYGSATDTGNTYNVASDAMLTGTRNGLRFIGGTVNNSGFIGGAAGFGVFSDQIATVNRAPRKIQPASDQAVWSDRKES